MALKQIKTSYNAGELSGYLDGREDLAKYHNGCSKLINATVLPHGGITKRPGTQYIATALNKTKLFPFEFSATDTLILEFSNLLIRFYKDSAQVFEPFGTEDLSDFDSASGDSSLVAHWKCEESSGAGAGDVTDDTVAGTHDGTPSADISNFTSTDAEGTANAAFDLDDTYFFTVADHANLSFGDSSDDSPFTFALWANFLTATETGTLISKATVAGNLYEYALNVVSGKLSIDLYDANQFSTAWFHQVKSDSEILAGWHFIVVTYDGRGGDNAGAGIKMYVDFSKVPSSIITAGANYVAMEDTASELAIGAVAGAHGAIWDGSIDNVAIFNKELSATEIASLTGNDSTTVYSIVSPYTSAQAFDVHFTQSADVMYLAHDSIHPKKLSRLADTAWTIEDVPFTGGPFLVENIIDTHLLGFARTGGVARSGYYFLTGTTGTLTATAHSPFNSNHVGSLWLIKHVRDNDNATSTFAKDTNVVPTLETFASGAIFIEGDFTCTVELVAGESAALWRKKGDELWQKFRGFSGNTSFPGTEKEKNVLYAMTRSVNTVDGTLTAKNAINYGIVKVTSVTNSGVAVVEVIDKVYADNSTDNAVTTFLWAEGAWSDFRGFPRTVTFFEDRLWWASTTNNPDTIWSSKSGLYENMAFTDLGLDDEALTFPLNDNEVSQIQWLLARQVMAIGGANKEYRFGAANPDDPVTPTDKKATPQTSFSSETIQPVLLNDTIFFFQRTGKKLGAMKFDVITENFTVDDATLLAYTLFESAPISLTVQRSPDSIIWIPRTDGVLTTFTYEPAEEVSGWARQIFGNAAAVETATGIVESTAVIHGTSEDEVWASVKWTINSSTVRHVVKFKPRDWGSDIEDACFVDSGITYDSTAASTMTGGTHLIGETVAVFADGVVFDNAVVDSSGEIILQKGGTTTTASTVQWGLPYTMKARTMRLSVPQEGNTLQTRIKRIHSTVVRFIRSLLGTAGQEYDGTEYLGAIQATFSNESQDTGRNDRLTSGGFSEDAYTTIVSSDPVPFTALSTIISFEVEDKR